MPHPAYSCTLPASASLQADDTHTHCGRGSAGGQASPAREVEHVESPELTAPLCDNVFKTRVCSHRGAAQVDGTADGSVAALRSVACIA